MVKTQVYLTEKENIDLKSLARRTGKKQSELIRQALDQFLMSKKSKEWKSALLPLKGIWKDRQDLSIIKNK